MWRNPFRESITRSCRGCQEVLLDTLVVCVAGTNAPYASETDAAASGMRAADLAQLGFSTPNDVLEGPFSYFRLYEGTWDIDPVWSESGTFWPITQVSHKPFPAGSVTHGRHRPYFATAR